MLCRFMNRILHFSNPILCKEISFLSPSYWSHCISTRLSEYSYMQQLNTIWSLVYIHFIRNHSADVIYCDSSGLFFFQEASVDIIRQFGGQLT